MYTPQIYENYTRRSGEGLSLAFVITWLLGDLFSLAGAIMAGLIPTVIILALYVSFSVCLRTKLVLMTKSHFSMHYATSPCYSKSTTTGYSTPLETS